MFLYFYLPPLFFKNKQITKKQNKNKKRKISLLPNYTGDVYFLSLLFVLIIIR